MVALSVCSLVVWCELLADVFPCCALVEWWVGGLIVGFGCCLGWLYMVCFAVGLDFAWWFDY